MPRFRLDKPERMLLWRLITFLAVATSVLVATTWIAMSDPHGLRGAPAITMGDVARLEPLYGGRNTPWFSLDWSPDGQWIAVGGGDSPYQALILDARTGSLAHVLTPGSSQPAEEALIPGVNVNAVRWSPSGRQLALIAESGFGSGAWVHLYSSQGVHEASWPTLQAYALGLAWAPDETRLLTAGGGDFEIWDVASRARLVHAVNVSTGNFVEWSPDGSLFAVGIYNGIYVYDATTATLVLHIPSSSEGVAWSHAGDRIVSATDRGCATVFRRDGSLLWQSTIGDCETSYGTLHPAWDPSDGMVATPNWKGVSLFDAATGRLLRTLVFPSEGYGPSLLLGGHEIGAAWSPTGEAIATVARSDAPSLRMWGIRRSSISIFSAAFETIIVIGLPLVLYPGPRLWFPIQSRRRLVLPTASSGGLLFLGAFVLAAVQGMQLDLDHRTYHALAMPSVRWFLSTAFLSILVGAFSAAVLLLAFEAGTGPNPTGPLGPRLQKAAGVVGPVLLPIVWFTGAGLLLASLLEMFGTKLTLELEGTILGTSGGAGLFVAGQFGPVLRLTSRRLTATLFSATLISFFAAFGLTFMLALFGGPMTSLLYGQELSLNRPTVIFGFGLAPFLFGLVALALVMATGAVSLALPKWAAALYSRLTRDQIVDQYARRKVLAYLEAHPGAHFRELLRALGMGSGTLHYHLRVLERAGIVLPLREGMYRRYFVAHTGFIPPQKSGPNLH